MARTSRRPAVQVLREARSNRRGTAGASGGARRNAVARSTTPRAGRD